MHRQRHTFCFPVALVYWWRAKLTRKIFLAVRRSNSIGGMVPHAAVVRDRGREVVIIDYIPRAPKGSVVGEGDSMCAFEGLYRVRKYRLEAIGTGDTFIGAVRGLWRRKP